MAIVGVGGRTGTMFAFELKDVVEVFGIGRETEIDLIKNEKLFIKRGKETILFKEKTIVDSEFPKEIAFDFLLLAVKNPVASVVRYYYEKIKEKNLKPPTLFLPQNGIEAGEEAMSILKEIFGKEKDNISVFRISLFNSVDKKIFDDKNYIIYSLPIRMAISKISGTDNPREIIEIFQKANFKTTLIPSKEVKNMEYSKLFLNLIGIASATKGFSVEQGLLKKEVFKEETEALREYIKLVKLSKGKFLNFPHCPVKFFSILISLLPLKLLFLFRRFLTELVKKGRAEKPKDLDEIDYYNGAVVKWGKKLLIPTPINQKILERAKKLKSKALNEILL